MLSQQPTRASGIREPSRLEAWKVVIAVGAAVTLAPVIALVLLVVIATALPVLPFVVPLLPPFWLRGTHRPPASAPGRSPIVTHPPFNARVLVEERMTGSTGPLDQWRGATEVDGV
jgi:hypothetical protein